MLHYSMNHMCTVLSEITSFLKIFICFFCEERFSSRYHLTLHQNTCGLRAFGLESLFKTLRLPDNRELTEPTHDRSAKRAFFESLNIVSVGRAEVLSKRHVPEQIVCDVIVIDDSDDDGAEVELVACPTSPRRLIPSDNKNVKRNSGICLSSGTKNETITTSQRAEKLFRIDVFSPLGQRLRNHVSMFNISKCRLLNSDCATLRSPLNDRLRQPSEYRVTFRQSRRSLYSHVYRFTSGQRREFCHAFDNGLSVRAGRLLKRMKPCRVMVSSLRSDVLNTYLTRSTEWEPKSDRSNLILRVRKSVVSLTKCDYEVIDGSIIDDKYSACRSEVAESSVTSNLHLFSIPVGSASYDADSLSADKSVLTLANSADSCNDNDQKSEASGDFSTDVQSCSDSLATPFASCEIELNPATSEVSLKTTKQTEENTVRSMEDATTMTTENVSSWSTIDGLSRLSFFCNICGDAVDCQRDAKSMIYDHYAGHGVVNIEAVEERTPSGERVIKLLELTIEKATTSKLTDDEMSSSSTAVEQKGPTHSKRPRCPSESFELSASSKTEAALRPKKRRRVTWADEVCDSNTQQSQKIGSADCPCTVHHVTALNSGSSKQRMTSNKLTTLNSDTVASASSGCNNTATFPTLVVTSGAVSNVPDADSALLPVRDTTPSSCPVSSMPLSVDQQCPDTIATASLRSRMFWSRSNMCELPPATSRPVSAALPVCSKRSADEMLLATSSPGGTWYAATDDIARYRKSVHSTPPAEHSPCIFPKTVSPNRNNVHTVADDDAWQRPGETTPSGVRRQHGQSHQKETDDVICID